MKTGLDSKEKQSCACALILGAVKKCEMAEELLTEAVRPSLFNTLA